MNRALTLALTATLTAALLIGCGAPHLRQIRSAQETLIGQPATALDCIGAPQSITDVASATAVPALTVWRFSSAQERDADGRLIAPTVPVVRGQTSGCVVDAQLADGRIVALTVDNRSGWGFGAIARCSALLNACAAAP